jgi:hypothetical protein
VSAFDSQKIIPNLTKKIIPSLYDPANSTIGTKLENKKRQRDKKKNTKKYDEEEEEGEEEEELIF